MSYKGVIFDFNGTLFFDNDKHILAWGKISQLIRGKGISDYELHSRINGSPNKETISYFFEGKCSQEENDRYSLLKEEYYRDFCAQDRENFHLVAGANEFFDQLKDKSIPFTIASASIKPNIDFFVESFQLDKWIEPDTIVYDNGSYQNKIAMFKKAGEILGVSLQDCLIIEDSKSGIESAYASGCEQILVINSADKKDEYEKLPGVIGVIEDFTELE
ncbi:MAG: HAD family phosphatase [Bacillota bacterium]|nr:HAD family phosphatase [Bacillota bacterium]